MSSHSEGVRFCPFCREPFEGLSQCPTHDLELVAFRDLPPDAEAQDDQPLPAASPRLGRGVLFVGAALTLLAFFLPLASMSGQLTATSSMFALARSQSRLLWMVLISAVGQVVVLRRRRTPRQLRGSRVFVLLCAIVPTLVVSYTVLGVHAAARLLQAQRVDIDVKIGAGAYLVWLAAPLMLYAGVRLGVHPTARVKVGTTLS